MEERKHVFYMCKRIKLLRSKVEQSFFFTTQKSEKKYRPIDIDGIRYKLDIETGEFRSYRKGEIQESFAQSVKRSKQFLSDLLDMNRFDWFVTLTFDNRIVNRNNDDEIYFAYFKFIDNLKHKYPELRYVTIPERHEDMTLHFHLMIGGVSCKELGFTDSGKVCCSWAWRKKGIASKEYFDRTKAGRILTCTDGLTIYNISKFPYGFSTASMIASRERCNWYVQKYLDKAFGSTLLWKKRFFYSSNLKRPYVHTTATKSEAYCNSEDFVKGTIENYFSNEQYHNYDYNFTKIVIEKQKFEIMNEIFVADNELLDIKEELPFEEEFEYGKFKENMYIKQRNK